MTEADRVCAQFWDTSQWAEYQRLCGVTDARVRGVPVRLPPSDATVQAVVERALTGYRDVGWQTWVLDLSPSEADLWRGIRKSYRSLIERAEADENLSWTRLSRGPCTRPLMAARNLHIARAGRETRPERTWELMAEWVDQGIGTLLMASTLTVVNHDEALAGAFPNVSTTLHGFAYLYIWGDWAYYGHAANARPNVSHAIQWRAIRYLKSIGVKHYELGWQARPGDTDKDRAISFFKRGFGGEAWWQPMWERVT